MKRLIGAVLLSLMMITTVVGCENGQTDDSSNTDSNTETSTSTSDKADAGSIEKKEKEKPVKEEVVKEQEKPVDNSSDIKPKADDAYITEVGVYGVDDNVMGLKKFMKSVKVYDKRVAAAALEALKSSDWPVGYASPIPSELTFSGVSINNGVATVKYVYSGSGLGSAGESAFVESVVYTLTEFSTINAVKFESVGSSLAISHMDSSEAFTRNSFGNALTIEN